MTTAEFTARYPEFRTIDPTRVQVILTDAAVLLGDAVRYGDLWDQAVAAQAAELLSRSPLGQPARAVEPGSAEPPRSQYWRTLREIKMRIPYRVMVLGGDDAG